MKTVSSLFIMHMGSNSGYAIAPLEEMFYKAGLELAGGDAARVHFAYKDFLNGAPNTLPSGFKNLIEFNFKTAGHDEIRNFSEYASSNQIEQVLIFDMQPVHPLFRSLRKAGVRSILSYWGAPISSISPTWKLLLKRLQVMSSRSKMDCLIFESKAMANFAVNGRGVPEKMIEILPLGVDIFKYKPAESSDYVHGVLDIPKNQKVIVYAGHVDRRKGVHSLIEAGIELIHRRKRKDVCLLICGNKENQSSEFEKMYEGLGIDNQIRFGGYRKDMAAILPSCFCGVIPSTGWDSFPRTPIEMAASGLPVIASRLHGLPEAVLDHHTGLLYEPGNAFAMADCMEKFLDNPSLATAYGRNGRRRCEGELNVEAQYRRFISILRKHI